MWLRPDFSIVILISGRGSNCLNLIRQAAQFYRVSAVISNKIDAPGLSLARDAGIDTYGFARQDASSLINHKRRIYREIGWLQPDLIVLAGFMQILEHSFVDLFEGQIVNIHPSLLPRFKGLDTHQRAVSAYLESGGVDNKHGCTVHYVDAGVDTGPIIAQAGCLVITGDNEERLAARVLEQEHKLYPWVINAIAKGMIKYQEGRAVVSPEALDEAEAQGFM